MKKISLNNAEYELIKDYREGFILEELEKRFTEYFEPYDYVVGDWAYGKLRLKGFYESSNKNVNKINDYKNVQKYLDENCAKDCRHFIVKKIK